MDDVSTYAFLTASFFFVALAVGLLVRYRQASQRLNASTDLGEDLWHSLEQRLRKQDERILDMMGRLEVIQSRVLATNSSQPTTAPSPTSSAVGLSPEPAATSHAPVIEAPLMQQPESQQSQASQTSQISQSPLPATSLQQVKLDETQLAAIKMLAEAPLNTRQLTDALKKSREHTARIMKDLYELGLVTRNDSSKPFVYQLTDAGRLAMPPSS